VSVAALALVAALASAGDPAARLEAGNALLAGGDAAGAGRVYEGLVADGLESPALHVNLGAARLRAGRRGAAVASWLRALRLDPGDADARANLALLRARGGDRLAPASEPPLVARLVERTPDGIAALAFLAPWLLLWTLLAARLRSGTRGRALLSSAAAIAALAAAAGAALVVLRDAERQVELAVVVRDGAPLRDGPEEALRPARTLREATVLRVLDGDGAALRVRLPDAREGFVAQSDVERLR